MVLDAIMSLPTLLAPFTYSKTSYATSSTSKEAGGHDDNLNRVVDALAIQIVRLLLH